jgi:hypothetical protein
LNKKDKKKKKNEPILPKPDKTIKMHAHAGDSSKKD